MIRMIDAVKSFDIIFAITQGGPGSASETINLYLYSVAFVYYDLGYGSAIAVVFFVLIVMLAAVHALRPPAHAVDRDREAAHEPRGRSSARSACAFAVFVIVSPAILFFLWMLSLSLKFEIDNAAYPPVFIPEHFAWENYARRARLEPLLTYFINSLIVTGTRDAAGARWSASRPATASRAWRRTSSAIVILIARITPGLSYLIPLFLLFQWLGLLGTLVPQIIIHLVVTVPIVIWIMIGYFETTPMELEEAALIDGATRWQVFRHVALPIAKPGIAVAFILAVIFSWNNFVFGIVLAGRETRTLPVAVYNMISFDQLSWGPLAAAALIVTLPVLLLTVFAQRQIVAGLTAGAVKGGWTSYTSSLTAFFSRAPFASARMRLSHVGRSDARSRSASRCGNNRAPDRHPRRGRAAPAPRAGRVRSPRDPPGSARRHRSRWCSARGCRASRPPP